MANAGAQANEIDWHDAKITDAGIDEIRAAIGVRKLLPGWNRTVTSEGIEHFALGLGDDNPLWWNADHAASSRWGRRIAPPCYLYSHMRGPRIRPEEGKQAVDEFLPGALGIFAGEVWRWRRFAHEGEVIRAETEMLDVTVIEGRFGGRSVSHLERHYLLTSKDELIAEVDHTTRRFERGQTRSRAAYLDRPIATYTAEDRERFAEQYEAEAKARRGSTPRYIEDVQVGEALGPMLKGPLNLTNMIGFLMGGGCGLNPANRMAHNFLKLHPGVRVVHPETGIPDTIEAPHWEPVLARASGIAGGYDFGFQRISWLSHLVTDWAGDDGFLSELQVKLVGMNIIGDITWMRGTVTEVDLATGLATVEITATNQLDEVTTRGLAKVRLPSKSGGAPG